MTPTALITLQRLLCDEISQAWFEGSLPPGPWNPQARLGEVENALGEVIAIARLALGAPSDALRDDQLIVLLYANARPEDFACLTGAPFPAPLPRFPRDARFTGQVLGLVVGGHRFTDRELWTALAKEGECPDGRSE